MWRRAAGFLSSNRLLQNDRLPRAEYKATCSIFWTVSSVIFMICPLVHQISTILELITELGDR